MFLRHQSNSSSLIKPFNIGSNYWSNEILNKSFVSFERTSCFPSPKEFSSNLFSVRYFQKIIFDVLSKDFGAGVISVDKLYESLINFKLSHDNSILFNWIEIISFSYLFSQLKKMINNLNKAKVQNNLILRNAG
jgi:hypothetical protein